MKFLMLMTSLCFLIKMNIGGGRFKAVYRFLPAKKKTGDYSVPVILCKWSSFSALEWGVLEC